MSACQTPRWLIGMVRVVRVVASSEKVRLGGASELTVVVLGSSWLMEPSMASRSTITKAQAVGYRSASRAGKSQILDLVCAVTGFNRDYARRALRQALGPRVVRPRSPDLMTTEV